MIPPLHGNVNSFIHISSASDDVPGNWLGSFHRRIEATITDGRRFVAVMAVTVPVRAGVQRSSFHYRKVKEVRGGGSLRQSNENAASS